MKYAVISNPRTGSRFLANKLSLQSGNPIGFLHFAKSVHSTCLTYKQLISSDWVLHGHWHTIHNLSDNHKLYIQEHYKIYEIYRDPLHSFISSIITMATGNIDFRQTEIPSIIDTELVYKYFERMSPVNKNKLDWNIDLCYNFDKLHNNTSLDNFKRNISSIENYQEIQSLYNKITKETDVS
jgi:hypothetical protein